MAGKKVAVIVGGIALLSAGCSHGDVASSATRLAASATTSTSLPMAPASTTSTAPPDTTASAGVAAGEAGAAGATPSTAATDPRPAVVTTAPPTTARPTTTTAAPTQEPPGSTAPPATDPPTTSAPQSAATITIQNFAFSPPVLDVAVGSTVTVTNRDGATHTWTADGGAWDSGGLLQNASYSHTFASPGTFTYHCAIHPSMKGTVNVS